MQIVMIYFLWSGPMIPTSKVKRGNNKSWYWQRNMRQLLIFCLLLTSFPFHVICFTGYSLSEALSNQGIQKLRQIVHFWLRVQYKTFTSSVHDVKSLKFFDLLIRWFHKYLALWIYKPCYLHSSQYIRINKQTQFHEKKSWIRSF